MQKALLTISTASTEALQTAEEEHGIAGMLHVPRTAACSGCGVRIAAEVR